MNSNLVSLHDHNAQDINRCHSSINQSINRHNSILILFKIPTGTQRQIEVIVSQFVVEAGLTQ